MAEQGSWPSIRTHGLLSTTALLDLFEVTGQRRHAIESRRRAGSVQLAHPKYGTAWIRDNLPINETVLRRTVAGMSVEDYYRSLNERVFFWVTEDRLDRLRLAGAYRSRQHDILVIDTTALLERYADAVELSHLNSGAVHPAANYPRGLGTFKKISDYPWAAREQVSTEPLVELTVPYAVPDIEDVVISVDTY